MARWVVLCSERVFGPFDDADTVERFRDVVTRHVDPARIVMLGDPVRELLGLVAHLEAEKDDRD